MKGLACPYCGWSPDPEALPIKPEIWRPIACGGCNQVFAISWHVVHESSMIKKLPTFTQNHPEFMRELEAVDA